MLLKIGCENFFKSNQGKDVFCSLTLTNNIFSVIKGGEIGLILGITLKQKPNAKNTQ